MSGDVSRIMRPKSADLPEMDLGGNSDPEKEVISVTFPAPLVLGYDDDELFGTRSKTGMDELRSTIKDCEDELEIPKGPESPIIKIVKFPFKLLIGFIAVVFSPLVGIYNFFKGHFSGSSAADPRTGRVPEPEGADIALEKK